MSDEQTSAKPNDAASLSPEARAASRVETKIATVSADLGGGVQSILEAKAAVRPEETQRSEVSAATVARMMGVATSGEIKLLEGKLDLLSSKFNAVVMKLDKVVSGFSALPTGSDLERIDVQIGALRTMLKEFVDTQTAMAEVQMEQQRALAEKAAASGAVKAPGKP